MTRERNSLGPGPWGTRVTTGQGVGSGQGLGTEAGVTAGVGSWETGPSRHGLGRWLGWVGLRRVLELGARIPPGPSLLRQRAGAKSESQS